jgi:hypothetical protein
MNMETGFLFVLYINVTSKSLSHISEEFAGGYIKITGLTIKSYLEHTTILLLRLLLSRKKGNWHAECVGGGGGV